MNTKNVVILPQTAEQLLSLYNPGYPCAEDMRRLAELRKALAATPDAPAYIQPEIDSISRRLFSGAICTLLRKFGRLQKQRCDQAYWNCDPDKSTDESEAIRRAHFPDVCTAEECNRIFGWWKRLDTDTKAQILHIDVEANSSELMRRNYCAKLWEESPIDRKKALYAKHNPGK